MKRLVFLNPVGLSEPFSTIRPGKEWIGVLERGEEVELMDPAGNVRGYAKVTDLWMGDLALMPASVVEMEQNPLHRTYSGLILGLKCMDGSKADLVQPGMVVTALVFSGYRKSTILKSVRN